MNKVAKKLNIFLQIEQQKELENSHKNLTKVHYRKSDILDKLSLYINGR